MPSANPQRQAWGLGPETDPRMMPRASASTCPPSRPLPSRRELDRTGLREAGGEREKGTKRGCQRARPSLGSGPSLGSALPSFTLPDFNPRMRVQWGS